jgi:hypothetical protein
MWYKFPVKTFGMVLVLGQRIDLYPTGGLLFNYNNS